MEASQHTIKNSWNEWAETWYLRYRTDEAISKIISNPASAFHPATYSLIREAFPSLQGKRVCVPSSGDNHAVYAFHLLGAQVTSCDISEKQIANSAAIARKHGWEIEFFVNDTMQLGSVADDTYDLVYTSNGVHVWIHDLNAMYRNIHRILRADGCSVMFDVHPFMRPFSGEAGALAVVNPYDNTGPFGDVPTYKWRVQDFVNAMASSGFRLAKMEEMYAEDGSFWVDDSDDNAKQPSQAELDSYCDWKSHPIAALPQWLSMRIVK
ncbi:class I SAM-dependent methyltransferase [Paenibacillus sp. OV219]|uniref:class I SAM-dependent methyltransferase n=1 Tax=Paenibacillus sp. OV219 TaxID=1884377 RepID=UPI0008C89AE1|nr:class I SAM-dependent methyltransferase [Paenibacillus sp. OV219]SEO66727.1 Methyltransferase domain-containing protein [Paenibacillus sp. OV219]